MSLSTSLHVHVKLYILSLEEWCLAAIPIQQVIRFKQK